MIATGLRKKKKQTRTKIKNKTCETIIAKQVGELPCAVDTPQGKPLLHGESQLGESGLAQNETYCEHSIGTKKS